MRLQRSLSVLGLLLVGITLGRAADPKPDWRAPLAKILTEVEAIPLEPWPPHEESEVCHDPTSKSYRILTPAGATTFAEKLPTSSEGIEKLWVLQNPPGFAYVAVNGRREMRWNRLYWQPGDKSWAQVHANQSAFTYEQGRAKHLRSVIAETGGNFNDDIRACGLLYSMGNETKNADALGKDQQELQQVTARLGQSWGGGAITYQLYLTEFQIATAPTSEQKVALAKQQRALLRQAVTYVKQPPPAKR